MNRQRSKVSTCHSHTIKPYGFTHTISLTLDPYDRTCARSCVACAPVRPRPSPLTHQTPRSPPPPEGRDRAIVSCSALASALVTAYHLPQRISASVAVGAPPACNPTYPASSPVYPACNPLHLSSSAHQRISSGESLRLTNEGLCQPKRPRRTCAVRYTCGAVHARCSARNVVCLRCMFGARAEGVLAVPAGAATAHLLARRLGLGHHGRRRRAVLLEALAVSLEAWDT